MSGEPPGPQAGPGQDRAKRTTGAKKEAWGRLLDEMEGLAADRRDEGWEVYTLRAGQTDTVTKDMGEHDRFGLFHVLPKSDWQTFDEVYDEEVFTEYLVYGNSVEGSMFAVTEFLDVDGDRSIMIANSYDMTRARGLTQNAVEEGELYTYVRKIDGTIVGSFRHEEYEPLLAKPN